MGRNSDLPCRFLSDLKRWEGKGLAIEAMAPGNHSLLEMEAESSTALLGSPTPGPAKGSAWMSARRPCDMPHIHMWTKAACGRGIWAGHHLCFSSDPVGHRHYQHSQHTSGFNFQLLPICPQPWSLPPPSHRLAP